MQSVDTVVGHTICKVSEGESPTTAATIYVDCNGSRNDVVSPPLTSVNVTPSRQLAFSKGVLEPSEACADFAMGGYPGSSWTLDDCLEVWNHFLGSVPPREWPRFPVVDVWKDLATEMRRLGSPCLMASTPSGDGAGSSTIRHLATWIFAEQMGCDWVTPDWGKMPAADGNGTIIYCRKPATIKEKASKTMEEKMAMRRCAVVNWLSYFQFDVPSVALPLPQIGKFNVIEVWDKMC